MSDIQTKITIFRLNDLTCDGSISQISCHEAYYIAMWLYHKVHNLLSVLIDMCHTVQAWYQITIHIQYHKTFVINTV